MKLIQAFLFLLVVMVGWVDAQAVLDAEFVSFTSPDTVWQDSQFNITIRMRNTGTGTWGLNQSPITMMAVNPTYNQRWMAFLGAYTQGHSTATNETWDFTIPLMSPHDTGLQSCDWQAQAWIGAALDTTGKEFYGDTARKNIYVRQRTIQPAAWPQNSNSRVLDSSDFTYLGCFVASRYDTGVVGISLKYGDSTTLIGSYGYPQMSPRHVKEFSIPTNLQITSGTSYSNCATARTIRDWGAVTVGTYNGEVCDPNSGVYYNNSDSLLYWTHNNAYCGFCNKTWPILTVTRLHADLTNENIATFWQPNDSMYKAFWSGVTPIDSQYAAQNTGGRKLLIGFGGYYSLTQPASRGPALSAINLYTNQNDSSDFDAVNGMYYRDGTEFVPRMGDYVSQPFWNSGWINKLRGAWGYNDESWSAVFIKNYRGKSGVIFFCNQQYNRIGYDFGGQSIVYDRRDMWYFYNIDTVAAAFRGDRSFYNVPYSTFRNMRVPGTIISSDSTRTNGKYIGACFDSTTGRLYLSRINEFNGTSIHVYSLNPVGVLKLDNRYVNIKYAEGVGVIVQGKDRRVFVRDLYRRGETYAPIDSFYVSSSDTDTVIVSRSGIHRFEVTR
jgi:hypothetical protein